MAIVFARIPTIRIVRGTAWSDDVELVDKDTQAPINLTGINGLMMRVRASINGPILLELSLDNAKLVIVDPADGKIGIRLSSADTLSLPEKSNRRVRYIYDMVIERSVGEYEPAVTGKLAVLPSITRPWGTT